MNGARRAEGGRGRRLRLGRLLRWGLLGGVLTLAAGTVRAAPGVAAAAASALAGPGACSQLTLQAEHGRCDAAGCVLQGNAQLGCDGRWLRADELVVYLREDRSFRGARARGRVSYVDGAQLLLAEEATLADDQVRGQVTGAQLMQFAPGTDAADAADATRAQRVSGALPRRTLLVQGELARAADRSWRARAASLTLCDCGNAPPSWELVAPQVRVDAAGTRATAFWPVLRLALLPGRTVPVTPPMPPISVPLSRRAFGLLPPRLQFFTPRAPSVELPLFVPLGESWDLTLSLGVRPDWAGSPRFGVRVRGRPGDADELVSELNLTYDRRSPARRAGSGGLADDPAWYAARAGLAARAYVAQRLELWPFGAPRPRAGVALPPWPRSLRLAGEVALASDNEVLREFAVAPAERAAAYLPSRLWLQAHDAHQALALQADFLQRLEATGTLASGATVPFPVGLRASSRGTVQRPLAARWRLRPHTLVGPLTADASVCWAWLLPLRKPEGGRSRALLAPEGALPGQAHLLGATVGVGVRRPWGPVHLDASVALDALARLTGDGSGALASELARLRAEIPLARRYAGGVHVVQPSAWLLGIDVRGDGQRPHRSAAPAAVRAVAAYDERLWRQPLLQGALGLRQAFWPHASGAGPRWRLDVWLPVDLRHPALLRPSASGLWALNARGQLAGTVGVAPRALRRGELAYALQDVDISASQALGAWSGWLQYARLSPAAERLQRTAYALAAPDVPAVGASGDAAGGAWQHTLGFGVAHAAQTGLSARYQASVQLPRSNPDTLGIEPACAGPGVGRGRRACLTAHAATLGYASRCNCWRADAGRSAAPSNFLGSFRFLVTLDVGGYRLNGG